MQTRLKLVTRATLFAALSFSYVSGCVHREVRPEPRCVLRVGTSGDYAPFSSADFDSTPQRHAGLDIVVAAGLADHLGCEVRFVRMHWPTLIEQLTRGDFDIALSGITMRPERALHGIFSRPYARTGAVVISRKLRGIANLNRPTTTLAVNRGGHLERWARENLPDAVLRPVDDNETLPALLSNGEVDGIVTDTAEAIGWSRVGNASGPFSTDYKAVFIGAHAAVNAGAIDDWLNAAEADGSLGNLRAKHLADRQVSSEAAATMQAVVALVRLRLELMPLVAATKRSIGKAVADGGQERRVIDRAVGWAPAATTKIETIFPVVMELAKQIQQRAPDHDSSESLSSLRSAIENIDRQLVREITRVPAADASAWAARLRSLAENLPLDAGEIRLLAEALAKAGTLGHRKPG